MCLRGRKAPGLEEEEEAVGGGTAGRRQEQDWTDGILVGASRNASFGINLSAHYNI